MKRRTRITMQLGALALAALGATYGLVAYQAPSSASLDTVAAASAASSINTTAPSIAPSVTPSSSSSSTRSVAPPVTHTRTRAS